MLIPIFSQAKRHTLFLEVTMDFSFEYAEENLIFADLK